MASTLMAPAGVLDESTHQLIRLMSRYNLQVAADVHPSWFPADWPVAHRQRLRSHALMLAPLSAALARRLALPTDYDVDFSGRRKRLALLDGASLRRIAWFCGLALHKPLLSRWRFADRLRRPLRRCSNPGDEDVSDRLPELPWVSQVDFAPLEQRPAAAARIVQHRGIRLLLSLLAQDGERVLRRVSVKLPRSQVDGDRPALSAIQLAELEELVMLSILPERLPQWHWLF